MPLAKETIQKVKEKYSDKYKISINELMQKNIREKFNYYNKKLFNNNIPTGLKITWSKRMTRSVGKCKYQLSDGKPLEIKLSTNYMRKKPEQLDSVLIHEMIHASGIHNHSHKFIAEVNRINKILKKDNYVKKNSDVRGKRKYALYCKNCKKAVGFRSKKSKHINNYLCNICKTKLIPVKLK